MSIDTEMRRDKIARRDFLKLASLSLGSMALRPWIWILELPDTLHGLTGIRYSN